MKVDVKYTFEPVNIVLETQDEVDSMFAILSNPHIKVEARVPDSVVMSLELLASNKLSAERCKSLDKYLENRYRRPRSKP